MSSADQTSARRKRRADKKAVPGFFDDYPRFLETSRTASGLTRLNLRHEAQIEANKDVLKGARVLDIASHDGRWSLAALKAGATHVTGIEGRPELVQYSNETMKLYGVPEGSYRFVAEDIFTALEHEDLDVDVVMCFGFLYHTLRYPEFFSKVRKLDADYLLIDTKVAPGQGRTIRVTADETAREAHAVQDAYTEGTRTLVGAPTQKALQVMLRVYGYGVEDAHDWAAMIKRIGGTAEDIAAYTKGQRVTWRCRFDPAVLPPSLEPTPEREAPVSSVDPD